MRSLAAESKYGIIGQIPKYLDTFLKNRGRLSSCSVQDHPPSCSIRLLRKKTPICVLSFMCPSKSLLTYSWPEMTWNGLEKLDKDFKQLENIYTRCQKHHISPNHSVKKDRHTYILINRKLSFPPVRINIEDLDIHHCWVEYLGIHHCWVE